MYWWILLGLFVGMGAAFTGLGGGFLVVPLLLLVGKEAQEAVGTSFLVILFTALSALVAHARLGNVDYRIGVLLALGAVAGAQVGARFLEGFPTLYFKRLFAGVLILLALLLLRP